MEQSFPERGFEMRCTVFLFILFSNVCLLAGTYQDEAGNRCSLKTRDGTDHPFDGHLAPNSSRQNIDLTNADFTKGVKHLKAKPQAEEQALKSFQQDRRMILITLARQLRYLQRAEKHIESMQKKIKSLSNDPAKQKNVEFQLEKVRKNMAGHVKRIKLLRAQLPAVNAAPDLQGIDLRGAKIQDATLDRVLLAEANLAKTDLTGTSLVNVDLSDTNLRNVELVAAQLIYADLSGADLRGAGVYFADFTGVNLSGTILRDVDGWEEAVWTHAYYQADDPPWWPEGMDAKKLNIREVSSEQKPVIEEIIE